MKAPKLDRVRAVRTILGIQILNRGMTATRVQELLTTHGCSIRTRLGLHYADESFCATDGLIILELAPNASTKLELELTKLKGVLVKKMKFGTKR